VVGGAPKIGVTRGSPKLGEDKYMEGEVQPPAPEGGGATKHTKTCGTEQAGFKETRDEGGPQN